MQKIRVTTMGRMTQQEARSILKVEPDATPRDIRSAYKKLALIYHPDKMENLEESTLKFQKISAAYKRLSNEDNSDEFEIDEEYSFQLFRKMFQHERHVVRVNTEHGSFLILGRCYDSRRYSNSSDEEFDASHYSFQKQAADKNADELINEESLAKKKAEKKRIKKQRQRENRRQAKEELQKQREEIKQERQKINDPKSTPALKDNKKNETKNAVKINKKKEKNATQNKENEERNCDKSFQTVKHKYNKFILMNKSVEKRKCKIPEETDSNEDEKEEVDIVEDDSEIDMNCAFFAKLANKKSLPTMKPKQANDATATSEDKPLNSTPITPNKKPVTKTEPAKVQTAKSTSNYQQIATDGNKKAADGNYSEAIALFTQAVTLNSNDYRIFGNRSYCFDKLAQFERALQDAERAIILMPDWSKGHFRKGRALIGLKKYQEAEKAFQEVLKQDKTCHDAETELFHVRVKQLQEMGFSKEQSVLAIRKYSSVNEAIENVLAGNIPDAFEEDVYISDDEEEELYDDTVAIDEEPVVEMPSTERESKSALWIGNVTEIVTESLLHRYFIQFGPILNIKINPVKMYAFVNYVEHDSATKALKANRCVEMMDTTLVLNYPAGRKFIPNRMQERQKTDIMNAQTNGQSKERIKECYFWRNTGCYNGPKCRFLHIPENQGIDSNRSLNN